MDYPFGPGAASRVRGGTVIMCGAQNNNNFNPGPYYSTVRSRIESEDLDGLRRDKNFFLTPQHSLLPQPI